MAKIGKILLISMAIYLAVTAVLITTDRPTAIVAASEPIEFEALTTIAYDDMPELQPYTARDGAELHFRLYESSDHFPETPSFRENPRPRSLSCCTAPVGTACSFTRWPVRSARRAWPTWSPRTCVGMGLIQNGAAMWTPSVSWKMTWLI